MRVITMGVQESPFRAAWITVVDLPSFQLGDMPRTGIHTQIQAVIKANDRLLYS